jgi:hypothetical protein
MIFEFRREHDGSKWQVLAITGGCRDRTNAHEALGSLRATLGKPLPCGAYRVRAVDEESCWALGEVDRRGAFSEFVA